MNVQKNQKDTQKQRTRNLENYIQHTSAEGVIATPTSLMFMCPFASLTHLSMDAEISCFGTLFSCKACVLS